VSYVSKTDPPQDSYEVAGFSISIN